MITVTDLTIQYGTRKVLDRVSWHVGSNDRIGLVGPNGAGKSTLMKAVAGLLIPDGGTINRPSETTVGYLQQETSHMHGKVLWNEVLTGRQDVLDLEQEMRRVEERIAEPGIAPRELEKRLAHYARLQESFEKIDGYTVETEAARVLAGLGFPRRRWHDLVETWSGGWQVRIALAKLLLQRPSYLLLDEPTNYLDLENIVWIEEYVKSYPGAVVIVSHDRTFLDNVITRITEVDNGAIFDYPGNYSQYVAAREMRIEQLIATAKNQEKRIREVAANIDRFRVTARRAAQAQSKLKMLERLENERVVVPRPRATVNIRFPECSRSGKEVLVAQDVGHAYGEHKVFSGATFQILRGDRVALVGVNGAGKSTLMRLCAGVEVPREGTLVLGSNVDRLYFAQDATFQLPVGQTILAFAEDGCDPEWRPYIRDLLGAFLFRGDDVLKQTQVLSGGEKSRLCLAQLLARHGNFLLLDEPTNHLDIETKEILIGALAKYTGTMLFVSHDRYFLERVATKVIEIESGRVTVYPWSYYEYLEWKEEEERERMNG